MKEARLFRLGRGPLCLSVPVEVVKDFGLENGDCFQVTVWANCEATVLSFKKPVVIKEGKGFYFGRVKGFHAPRGL